MKNTYLYFIDYNTMKIRILTTKFHSGEHFNQREFSLIPALRPGNTCINKIAPKAQARFAQIHLNK